VLGDIKLEGVAAATGAAFVAMENDGEVGDALDEAMKISLTGRPVILDVKVDYSRKTEFTSGVVKTNLARFPLGEKIRFIGRAIRRHVLG
jgi:acetolactate synthase-1/2/3 large subunit